MAAISTSLRVLSGAFLLLLILSSATAGPSAHDILKKFGLPKGLFPHTAKDYTLADDGTFEVRLKKPCYVQFADLVYYGKILRGKIDYGVISDIEGIQVKKVLFWFPLSKIVADKESKTVQFQVGFLHEKFPAKMFKEVLDCKDSSPDGDGLIHEELLPVSEV